jgi:hypothetical protein
MTFIIPVLIIVASVIVLTLCMFSSMQSRIEEREGGE